MITPFLVKNGTGAAIIIAPGGGYHDLSYGKEGTSVECRTRTIHLSRRRRLLRDDPPLNSLSFDPPLNSLSLLLPIAFIVSRCIIHN